MLTATPPEASYVTGLFAAANTYPVGAVIWIAGGLGALFLWLYFNRK